MNHIAREKKSVLKAYRPTLRWEAAMTNANWS